MYFAVNLFWFYAWTFNSHTRRVRIKGHEDPVMLLVLLEVVKNKMMLLLSIEGKSLIKIVFLCFIRCCEFIQIINTNYNF